MKVIKELQWDMGHRITNHRSQCRNLHGHRYKAEICIEGDLVGIEGISNEGMVIDFGDIKKIAVKHIHNVLDHGFMVWNKDKVLMEYFKKNADQKHIIVSFVPTCENIAAWIFNQLDSHIKDRYKNGLRLHSIKLWETPTSVVICTRNDVKKLTKRL
ncbi:6-carboxytetrahydropterin synthase [Candidatus Dojkabacteria bacterium]|uniref:6-carboxy-5,6,7,8-tetrahydropterin synthase n=1 Tax=Candidatus Dojkabacteria bacterium TaxID=2099670 RepID=A0A3M0Z5Y4_9BACT|nr:MAG: 6-carboxytetrahydropterin synthase [Candidatus Dojkabacteria bacterium]